jgi:signal transduction histidine kinase
LRAVGQLRTTTEVDPSAEVFMPRMTAGRPHVADPAAAIDDAPLSASDHAALGRVAALVARGAAEEVLFAAAAEEIGRLVGADRSWLVRFDRDAAVVVATHGGEAPADERWPLTRDLRRLRDAGQGLRFVLTSEYERFPEQMVADGLRHAVGVPIVVNGRVWGAAIAAVHRDEPFPKDTEPRMTLLARLLATPLAGAGHHQVDVERLAEEQASLRRVAALVERGVEPEEFFAAVATEAATLMGRPASLLKYEEDGVYTMRAMSDGPLGVGMRVVYDPGCIAWRVKRSGTCERIDDYAEVPTAKFAHEIGLHAIVGAPINVDGELWGAICSLSFDGPCPVGTEVTLAQFASLSAAALANASTRTELTASRARVVAAADESRRRLQRDVHDGAQQRLVQTVLTLKLAREALDEESGEGFELIDEALRQAEQATTELREVVRGILPAALARGGLEAGVRSLVADLPVPVDIDIAVPRLEPTIETTAYFVIAEALTNVVKHAHATHARVTAAIDGDAVEITVRDDGVGGADPAGGSGLVGLRDRVAARDGTLEVHSAPGDGTSLRVRLPAS